ncbi:MAG: class I tRNA ligase family protein [Bacillota bacterium]|nr:MAG: hypothetical protein DIU70_02120 [Bacillota bacterium]
MLHLLYTRFLVMALHDLGLVPFDTPFRRFRAHGVITRDGAKMSKSRGNVVNPDEYFDRYGADTLRTYLMFMGAYSEGGDFSDAGIRGVHRFLHRVWALVQRYRQQGRDREPAGLSPDRLRTLHRTVARVTQNLEGLRYNTAIAALMEFANHLQAQDLLARREVETLLLLLAPFAPYITEELWEQIGGPFSIHYQPWPTYDPALAEEEVWEVAVQVNGRVREVLRLPPGESQEAVVAAALAAPRVAAALRGRPVRRVYYVPGRTLNLVVDGEAAG